MKPWRVEGRSPNGKAMTPQDFKRKDLARREAEKIIELGGTAKYFNKDEVGNE